MRNIYTWARPLSFRFWQGRQNQGFTLTELLVTIAIFILVLGTVYSAYFLSQQGYQNGEAAAEAVQNSRVILERMTREIRQAREIVTELPDDEVGATGIIEFEDGHTTTSYRYICYYQENSDVKRKVKRYYFPSDPSIFFPWNATSPSEALVATTVEGPVTIGEHIELAGLKFWGSRVINISIALTKNNQSIDSSTKIFGRNL